MRLFLRWFLFTLCLVIFTGVMVWISVRMLDLEAQRRRTAADAQVQEKLRLALWRMDSLASTLLIRENARPVYHYQAFYAPEDLFASATRSIPKGQALMPSPLFGSLPELVQLHFEETDGSVTSPQAPAGGQREIATSWYTLNPQISTATEKLATLGALLKRHPEIRNAPTLSTTRMIETKPQPESPPPVSSPSTASVKATTKAEVQAMDNDKAKALDIAEVAPKSSPQEAQVQANRMEQTQRGLVFNNSIALEKKEAEKPMLKKIAPPSKSKIAPAPAAATAAKDSKADLAKNTESAAGSAAKSSMTPSRDSLSDSASSSRSESPTESNRDTSRTRNPLAEGLASVSSRYRSQDSLSEEAEAASLTRQALPALAGDLQPMWVEQELLLIRQATLEGRSRLQGVWLDWPALQKQLLETIHDLLPGARLQPISPEAARTDASALVTLPVKLFTGPVSITLPNGNSALKPALLLAWACLAAASLAIAFVLHRAVLLSERRGAFVSAVTHELRTPLTTFRLYSEMLADDMVPDPQARRRYLQTLCDESTRLMHLVENVLAFSRIERGRTAGRMETLTVQSLLDRILPRLKQRTDQVDLDLRLHADATAAQAQVKVDALAVEQILFNLTDNASKYAAPDCDPRTLDLTVESRGDRILFTVRDHGPGLPAAQKKRLFQPFSKSATEAAHSAPGVGLGLALSRRLARELGGDLIHRKPASGRGTEFQLSVRQA